MAFADKLIRSFVNFAAASRVQFHKFRRIRAPAQALRQGTDAAGTSPPPNGNAKRASSATESSRAIAIRPVSPADVEFSVPRYFFHFSDGRRQFTDETGHELAGIRAARAHAVREVREMRAALCETGVRDLSGLTMLVVDGQGRAVFSLGFDLRPRETGAPRPVSVPERGTQAAAKVLSKKS